MKITKTDLKYLKGEKFDVDYHMIFSKEKRYDRLDAIIDIVKGKSVIHVGCCDHINVIDEKIKKGTWLHKLLNDNCSRVLGLDINEDAIKYIKENNYADNIIYNNIVTDKPIKIEKKYDYMVLGEILEHVPNPVEFLASIRSKYSNKVNNIIITVPNALKYCVMGNINYEGINSDHKYYFTPYTLSKVLCEAGFIPDEILFADAYKNINIFGLIHTVKCKPQFGMTVIAIARF